MSDTFRKSILNRLPALPPTRAPWADTPEDHMGDENEEEELEEDGDGLSELGAALPSTSRSMAMEQDLTQISASGYYTQALEVTPSGSDTTFRVYLTPPQPPRSSQDQVKGKGKGNGTVLVCHHGAGSSGSSFAMMAKEVEERSGGEMGVLGYDCRGHGKTKSQNGKARDTDLSLSTLLSDLLGLIQHLYPDPDSSPSFVLLGHSMGAAPILSSAPILQERGYTIAGVVVLDVVEGTAVEALPLMKSILAQRPKSFKSVTDAIRWHVTSTSIRNSTSARISVPSYLRPSEESNPGPESRQVWRTDLLATEPYWEEWYQNLSSRFLSAKCARLLVLAGQERLDRELMVGQMQGKFQLEVMSDVGHYLHEDDPAKLAATLVTFWRRNTRVLVLPPKIGSEVAVNGGSGRRRGEVVKRVGED